MKSIGHIFFLKLIAIILTLFICVAPCMAADDETILNEYLVKAAFIYNFAKFVEWPPCDTGNCSENKLVVGLYGGGNLAGSVGEAMNTIAGKTVGNRVISVRYISDPADISNCQIVYLFSAESKNVKAALDMMKGHPILSVSDMNDFAYSGGMIELMKVGAKLRFAINRRAALDSSIRISSQLLKLARYVVE
jgi:hypothetical protein